MSTAPLFIVSIVLIVVAYFTYGRVVRRWLGVDPDRPTPAHTLRDDVDYVPARRAVLVGHHFASIAGAAPIIGPVTAIAYGWGPVWLWIIVGGVLMGAVHDFASLMASIRHEGKSIGEVVEVHLGFAGRTLFLIFSWTALILVVAVFAIVVAKTFVAVPEAATASILFIVLALAFGILVNKMKMPLVPASIVGVVLLFGCIVAGDRLPLELSQDAWIWILLGYIFIASVAPVQILLQPRDYLNSFLLYAMLLLGFMGIVWANPGLEAEFTTSFHVEGKGYLFPILFVTVACGAISGFHSLVSSGTTAKQLDSEKDAQVVGYGSMLVESLLAVLALIAVAYMTKDHLAGFMGEGGGGPVAAFSAGLGALIGELGLPAETATNFVALAVSAFALTSLDTATRLSRFAFQEFFEPRRRPSTDDGDVPASTPTPFLARNRFVATTISVAAAGALALSGSYKKIWPIFGSANQLLAALALLAVSVWLARRKRQNLFTIIPMFIMFAVTLTSLTILASDHLLEEGGNRILGVVAVLLFGVGVVLASMSMKTLFGKQREAS